MSVTIRPFVAGLGADISGVDIREPLSTADRAAIRAAWLANLALRFRSQPMLATAAGGGPHPSARLDAANASPAELLAAGVAGRLAKPLRPLRSRRSPGPCRRH
jgi:alpha-ketoglutarate-dependent taurine dioxygenase